MLALGLADHAVTEEELAKGETPPVPRFNTPGVAYVWRQSQEGRHRRDRARQGRQAADAQHRDAQRGQGEPCCRPASEAVPAGGWPEGEYQASLKITRDGKTLIEQATDPIPFE